MNEGSTTGEDRPDYAQEQAATEPERRLHRSRISRLPLRLAVRRTVAVSIAAAVILFGALTAQMVAGQDPSMGVESEDDHTDTDTASTGETAIDLLFALATDDEESQTPDPSSVETSTS